MNLTRILQTVLY